MWLKSSSVLVMTAAFGISLTLGACAKHDESDPGSRVNQSPDDSGDGLSQAQRRAMMQEDMNALGTLDSNLAQKYDRSNDGLFSRAFGGTSPQILVDYLQDRIHVIADPEEINSQISQLKLRYSGWLSDSKKGEMGAANLGAMIWLIGLVEAKDLSVDVDGKTIPVNSSRAGLIVAGPGYRQSVRANGKKYTLPIEYRQAILIHEARHSDCTGGITDADVRALRKFKSSAEFNTKYTAKRCGHLHTICPAGHDFEGVAACDDMSWGAYAMDAIFTAASQEKFPEGSVNWQIMKQTALDAFDRLLGDAKTKNYGNTWADLTSQGLLN